MTPRAKPATLRFTLLMVDDHTIVREGLRYVLDPIASEWSIMEAASAFQALDLLRRQRCDLVILDLSMPGMGGLELIRRIRSEYPDVRILVLSMHAEEQYAMRSFKAGASGYVTKGSASAELVIAVRKVAAGGTYVTATLAENFVKRLNGRQAEPKLSGLSDRELEVLKRIVCGERLTDIANDLHLSVKTVSSHKARIQEKLELPNVAALIRFGLEHQLDDRDSGSTPLPGV
jgi:DNA-binding NarL/FixJ family response regulator